MIAADVAALFPSLEANESARICRELVEESELEFRNVDYQEILLYVRMNLDQCSEYEPLKPYLPERLFEKGKAPGMHSEYMKGSKKHRDLKKKQWKEKIFPRDPALEKKLLGLAVEIGIKQLFTKFAYTFGGKVYKQMKGAR